MDIAQIEAARNELDRRSMIRFASRMNPTYTWNWHHKVIADTLERFFKGELKRVMLFVPPQHAKLLADDTPIFTNNGWNTHGNLKVGDIIYGRYKQEIKVLHINPKSIADKRVFFDGGTYIDCNGEHEWIVWHKGRELILTTNSLQPGVFCIDDGRFIKNVEDIYPKQGNCITVEGGIYLAGLTLIPTHNSTFTSQMFPAWALGKNPELKVILASYSASVAESMNRDVQKYIDTPDYVELFPETKLQAAGANGKYIRNAERFDIVDHRGYFKSVGVGGSLTGTPADIAIIDDPHKDREQAKSATISQSVWDWYTDVLRTRLNNKSGVLLIQTRWDTQDLAGRILAQQKEAMDRGDKDIEYWTVICFPAIKENNDNADDPRKIGEALWPAMHSLERLNQIRSTSLRTFQSLYQQNPMPVQAGGECYKGFDMNANVGKYDEDVPTSIRYLYDPNIPLHFSFDFNVNPYMTCGVYQVYKEDVAGKSYFKAYKIEEICMRSPNNTTKGICRHIRTKYGGRHLSTCYICGDPNGMKEDTRSEKGHNDYLIIKQELAQFKPTFRVATKAPAVATRIEFLNSVFSFSVPELEFYIEDKCINTKNDYLYIKEESDGSKQKLKALDPITGINSERYGHTSDEGDYFITATFPNIYGKHQRGNSMTNIVLGQRVSRHGY